MISVIAVVPKNVHVILEVPMENIKQLKDILDHAQIDYNGEEEPEMIEAVDFLNEMFYPLLKDILKRNE